MFKKRWFRIMFRKRRILLKEVKYIEPIETNATFKTEISKLTLSLNLKASFNSFSIIN